MKTNIKVFYLLTIFTLLNACVSRPGTENTSLDKMINDAFQKEHMAVDVAVLSAEDDISSALLPDINLSAPGFGSIDIEPRFDIKVNRAKARQFFMGLVLDSNYNMVLHPNVSGRISLDLKNVTVEEVMVIVRDVYGYDFEKTKTAFSVFSNEIRTQIFNVNYINIRRTGSSQMSVKSNAVAAGGDSGSNISTVSSSDFWTKLEENLKALVVGAGSSVLVSPQSGIVVVRALPRVLRLVEKFIKKTQDFIQRQVIIKAKILEVELNEHFQTGINWAKLAASGNDRLVIGQTGGGSLLRGGPSGLSGIAGNTGNLSPDALQQITGTTASAFGGMFSLALNLGEDFSAFIELLKNQGEVHVLSSPHISTINNQKAVIKVGQDELFITGVSNSTTSGTAGGTSTALSNVTFKSFFSGVALDVIAQIAEDGTVILHVHPTVSSVTEIVKTVNSSGSITSVPLAVSSVRESDSIIRAKSGQVVIIGGLMQNRVERRESKIPILGDLPLLGGLFRHNQDITTKSELVILLKPIVINTDEEIAQQVKKVKNRFRKIQF